MPATKAKPKTKAPNRIKKLTGRVARPERIFCRVPSEFADWIAEIQRELTGIRQPSLTDIVIEAVRQLRDRTRAEKKTLPKG